MNLQDIALKPAASAASNTVNTGAAAQENARAGDFHALFSSQLRQMKQDFAETGLTPADQALYAVGGEEVLKAKKDLQERGSALVTDAKEAKQKADKRLEAMSRQSNPALETLKRHMPDGSIMVLTYENGKLIEAEKHKPHLVAKADYSRPTKLVNGEEKPQIKLVPRLNLLEDI